MSPTQKVTGESTAATTKAHIEAPKNGRLEQKKLFGLMDTDPTLTPLERLKTCHALQFTQGSNSSEFTVVASLIPVSAEANGKKTIYEITLTTFYVSARNTLSSWSAASIFDIATLLSLSTITSLPPTDWCIDLPWHPSNIAAAKKGSGEKDGTTRIMNFAGTTRSLNITYSRPAFLGQKLRVECEVVALSKQQCLIRADLRDEKGKVVASAMHDVVSIAGALRGKI